MRSNTRAFFGDRFLGNLHQYFLTFAQEVVAGQLAHLFGGGSRLVPDVNSPVVAIEVDALGVDDDQPRAALGDRLLDAQVDDRHVILGVRCDDDDDARVI